MDGVSVIQCVFQPFQQDDPQTAAHRGSLCLSVKGSAPPIRRENAALLIHIPGFLRNHDGHAPGQGHVAVEIHQAPACEMDGHQ